MTNNSNVMLQFDKNHVKCFTHHFLLGNSRGGFPLLEVFLGVVVVGTVRESMVTLVSRIKLSRVNCSALTPGGIPAAFAERWGSEFELETDKIRWISVLNVQKVVCLHIVYSYTVFCLCYMSISCYHVCISCIPCKWFIKLVNFFQYSLQKEILSWFIYICQSLITS